MSKFEVLVLHDSCKRGRWHLNPDIHDCVGWWPDGSPAWVDDPEDIDGNRIVLDVIPKRKPVDDDWLEDDPRVHKLIDLAVTLNDVFLPWPRSAIADARAAGDSVAEAQAVNARIRQSFGPEGPCWVLDLARQILERRHSPEDR